MQVWKTRLSVLLVLQLLLAGGLWVRTSRVASAQHAEKNLFNFQADSISKIEVTEGEETLDLVKQDNSWVIPDKFDLPAGPDKVESLLSGLEELKITTPETTSTGSHERFNLSDEKPEGAIKLFQGEQEVAAVLVGKVPSFGERYLRLKDQEEIYRVDWQGISTSPAGKSWLDHDILALSEVTKVVFPGFTLSKDGETWTSGKDQALDQNKVGSLLSQLRKLRIIDAIELPLADKTTTLEAELPDSSKLSYQLFADSEKYYAKRSDREQVFQIGKEAYDKLTGASLSHLLVEEAPDQD